VSHWAEYGAILTFLLNEIETSSIKHPSAAQYPANIVSVIIDLME
jgi:hypothetical protein